MNMIMRANATQVSVSTWNIDGDGWSSPFIWFTSSQNGLYRNIRSLSNFGYSSCWMRIGNYKSKRFLK